MKKHGAVLGLCIVLLLVPPLGMSWGYVGHRICGLVAEHYLTDETRTAVEALLDGERLSSVMSWADDMRDDPYWREQKAGTWHYLNVEDGKTYSPSADKPDVYTQILYYESVLRDKGASKDDRAIALKWYAHLVTDIHQPLHVGKGSDRGGNSVKVTFLGEETNLHSLWDTKMIMNRKVGESSYAAFLIENTTRAKRKRWAKASYRDWIDEGVKLRKKVYGFKGTELGENYFRKNIKHVDERMAMGGYRLAIRLNAIFGE